MNGRIVLLGGGQLARMSALAAYRLGFEVGVVVPGELHGPAADVATRRWFADWLEPSQLQDIAEWGGAVTLENEFLHPDILAAFQERGLVVIPSPATLFRVQDKLSQKSALKSAGIPVAEFAGVIDERSVLSFAARHGWPVVLKSRTQGYDGYGNALAKGPEDLPAALAQLEGRGAGLMVEAFVPFRRELAIMIARNATGEVAYPLVETIQQNHICHTVLAPAAGAGAAATSAREMATAALDAIGGQGLYGIEFFELQDGALLVNEIAPRPHNSGHYTIDACATSQFENHVRAVAGLPLGSPAMLSPAAVMVNVLGTTSEPASPALLAGALAEEGVRVHLYGKRHSRPGRKMGHVTALGATLEEARARATRAAGRIRL